MLFRRLIRPVLIVLIAYVLLVGATYTGILTPALRWIDVGIVVGVGLAWSWTQRHWRWQRTPLDLAIVIWIAAFVLSLVTNLDSWRRIAMGLWFMGLYVGAWYVLIQALANGALRRLWLIDAVLIAGVPVVFVGFAQVWLAITNELALPRPVGTLGNANTLAAFLVVLLPFAAGRLMSMKSPLSRVLLALYTGASGALLLLTFSRGGWLGAAVGLTVWVILRFPVRQIWAKLPRIQKAAVVVGVGLLVAVGALVIIESFSIGGRGIGLRTWLYETALELFARKPLTGQGLFTFGAGLSRLNSLPPLEPHSHAHNIILHVAAELGIVGLVALALTAWVALRVFWRTLRQAIQHAADPVTVIGIAAFAGFATHQMLDLPAMMPTIALVALITLVIAVAPGESAVEVGMLSSRRAWQPILLAVGALALVISGVWSAANNSRYVAILTDANASKAFHAAADQLQALANTDPDFALYPEQQGILLGLAAAAGDPAAVQAGVERFERFTTLEPDYANGWANLAALHAALGEDQAAVDAMQHAVDLAPSSWSLVYRYGVYAEAAGDNDTARQAYQAALDLGHDVALIPGWGDSVLRRDLTPDESDLSDFGRTLLMLERGENEAAQAFALDHTGGATDVSGEFALRMLLALSRGDRETAAAYLAQARSSVISRNGRIWTQVGAALLANDDTAFEQQVAIAREALIGAPYETDWELGENIAYIQYLSLAIPRQFIPQVGYFELDQALIHLLGEAGAVENLRAALTSQDGV